MREKKTKWPLLLVAIFFPLIAGWSQKSDFAVDSVAYYLNQNEYTKAKIYAEKKSATYLSRKQYLDYSKNAIQIANIYYSLNDTEKALKVLYGALKKTEDNHEKIGEIIIYRSIGDIYSRRHDMVKAKKSFYAALVRAKRINNDSLVAALNQPLFKVHAFTESDSAEFYLKKTMAYSKRINTPVARYMAYNNYFFHYYEQEKYTLAKAYLDSAAYFAQKSGVKKHQKTVLVNTAGYYVQVGNYAAAKKAYDEMFKRNPNDTLSIDTGNYYYTYADILSKLGNYRDAYIYADKAVAIREHNFDISVNQRIADVAGSYQISNMEEQMKLKEEQHQKDQYRNYIVLIILAAVFLLTVILFYFFYQNNALKQKNKLQDIQSKTQQNILSATLDAQESERKKIASVLHDNISALLSSAGLQLTAYASGHETSDEITKTRQILKEAHDKVRDLSHELVPTLLAKFGLSYALQDLCEKNSNKTISFEYTDNGSIKRYDEDFETKVYFIVSELLNNVLKHSKASKSKVSLSATNVLSITVEDNGKGFDTTKPLSSEGFGLTQIRARVNGLGGHFSVTSKQGQGTLAHFSVPVP